MSGDQKWLVKSSDSIMGPYEFDSVVEKIFSGDIHLLDEIKGPFERWRPIKDHSLFAAAIERLKASTYSSREGTMTATLDVGTKTHELTHSDTLSINEENTKTPTINTDNEATSAARPGHVTEQSPRQERPVLSYQEPPTRRFPMAFVISFLLIVLGGVSYLIYEFKQSRLIEQKISAYDQLTDNAILNLRTGEYREALDNFKMARNINSKDPNLIIEMAPLLVQFDGQFSRVESSLEKLLVATRQKTLQKMAYNTIGMTHSYRGQFKAALAAYDSALGLDDQYLPARVNKAYALLKVQQYDEAVQLMKKVVGDHPDESIAHLLYIRSLVEKGINSGERAAINEALSVADQFSQRFSDFKQEILFLIAVAKLKISNEPSELKQNVIHFLKVDLALTSLHVHDVQFDFQSFNWQDFNGYCRSLQGALEPFYGRMLEGFCLLKTNRTLDAKQIFDELVAKKSEDGLLQALTTSSLFSLNQISDAKNSLGFINQVDRKQPLVETILRGCLDADDLSCGEAIYKGQHGKHLSLLYSHWGNSAVLMKNDRRKARRSVVKGLKLSPNFAPLLKINRRF